LTEGVHRYFKHILGRPELLNRIGQNIIVFDYVRPTVMRQILERKVLRSIAAQVYDRWHMRVEFSSLVVDQLMEVMAKDISSGGRGVGNLAEHAIVNPLARAMFQLLGEGKSLDKLALLVTGVQFPNEANNDHRYDITCVTREVEDVAPNALAAPDAEAAAHAPA
jgi:ATP-dependent Clp protease ATP-binding subunit ClpA